VTWFTAVTRALPYNKSRMKTIGPTPPSRMEDAAPYGAA
jgi:hypothetical protein